MTYVDEFLALLPQPWRSLAIPFAVFVVVVAAGMVVRRIVFAKVRSWAKSHAASHFDETVLESFHGPILMWVVMLGIYVATDASTLPKNWSDWSKTALSVLWILSLTIVLARFTGRMLRSMSREKDAGVPRGSLTEVVSNIVIGLLGLLFLLRTLGIDVTPILTALGVGGIAVALALQDTLANLFAGIYIGIAGEIRIGDFVQLDAGHHGYVVDIGWRATTIRERTNNMIVVPNKKLAESIVTNFHLPEKRMMLMIHVGVDMHVDPDFAEKAILDAYQEIVEINTGLLREPKPVALLLPGFGQHALEYTLICWVTDYEAQFSVQDQLRKSIWRIFRDRGIGIPFPTRTIQYTQLPAPPADGA